MNHIHFVKNHKKLSLYYEITEAQEERDYRKTSADEL